MGNEFKKKTMRLSTLSSGRLRHLRQVVFFVMEGKNTEPAYFDWLKTNGWISSRFALRLDRSTGATDAKNLLRRAERLRKSNPDAVVCIILDKDRNSQDSINELYQWQSNHPKNCKVAVSFQKFELFLLMHYGEVFGVKTPSEIDSKMELVEPGYGRKKIPKMKNRTRQDLEREISLAQSKVNQLPDKDVSQIAALVQWLISAE